MAVSWNSCSMLRCRSSMPHNASCQRQTTGENCLIHAASLKYLKGSLGNRIPGYTVSFYPVLLCSSYVSAFCFLNLPCPKQLPTFLWQGSHAFDRFLTGSRSTTEHLLHILLHIFPRERQESFTSGTSASHTAIQGQESRSETKVSIPERLP